MTPSWPPLLHDLLDGAAGRHPRAGAVSDDTGLVDYRWLDAASRRLASWLAGRGVGRGDRVVLAIPPCVLGPALIYGCSRAAAVFVMVSEQVPEPVLAHVLADAEPTLVVTGSTSIGRAAATGGVQVATLAQADAAAEEAATPPPVSPPLAVDPACLIYTSGSTGRPRAVVCTHAQMTFAATAIASQLGYSSQDVVYTALPLSFDYGLYQIFLAAISGARVHLAPAARVGAGLVAHLRDTGATVLPAVPSLASALCKLLRRPGTEPPRLRLLTSTGAAMPERVPGELRALIPTLRVQLMYGLTECKRATIMPPDEDARRPGACGLALPGTEVFAADSAGGRLPAGEIGEIAVRGPHVMAGYWRCPELTQSRFRRVDGLFPQLHTGDYGWLDNDGYLYFRGRRDGQYKERGFRVSVIEVEAAAHRVPGVLAAAVLPPGDGSDGATLVAMADLAPPELLARLRSELEDFKVPGSCVVVPELPLTENGKVDRTRLARLVRPGGISELVTDGSDG
jgi:acyl-CoA synthetase (AMP-forming)/AMP-acid ligase II